jgi:hypothetical protein
MLQCRERQQRADFVAEVVNERSKGRLGVEEAWLPLARLGAVALNRLH